MTHPVRYRPGDALLALHRRRGPMVDAGIGRHGYVYLFGAQANKFVFANSDAFNWWEAFQVLVPIDGPTALIVSDGADHRRRRSLVQPAFHHRHIANYLQIMAANADAVIDSWRPGDPVDIFAQLRSAIRRSAIESLFGQRMAGHTDFLGEQLQPLMDLTSRLPQVLRAEQRLRSPAWRRAMAAKARVDELIYAEIARARAHPDADDNVLTTLINGRTEDGQALRDDEIRDQVVSLIAAGYETTSAAMGWVVYTLLSTPGVWETAAAEVKSVAGERAPDAADLNALTYLNGVVHETLRLYPPAVISARKVTRDLTFAGRRIHAGRTLVFSPYVTHRLPELWADPLDFQPRRWDPASPLYRRPAPYEFLPFGGGTHRCIGSGFATAELTVMLARLLAKTELTLPDQRIRAGGYAALQPRDGLIVHVRGLR
ncbi:putative cytochrome P450 139 [Mycolicibacter terrae]|uniref:Cytochrome P450 139 n=1 Tax=Mycolicibacter terrae TaxID=1788 RepID=A0AAD1MI07_9MYCO|nr:cytochrome P450 [Mycolicibacter terrae]ORW96082.1 cytochrome P450 [Mycolicibacter terrae]BBX24013.1 putative cytochrome P450 139 [Mycolicibacter terrae]SNV57283.1 cytochrome P450 [Mycolicibacter terrae]